MATRSTGGRIAPVQRISRYACDRCMRGLQIPFSALCFEPDGSEYTVTNRLVDELGRVVVYMHESCTVAAKTCGPVVYAADSDTRGMIMVAGNRSYTIEDVRVVMDGHRFMSVLPNIEPY